MQKIIFFNYEYPPLGGGAANATEQLFKEYTKQKEFYFELITSAISDKYEKINLSSNVVIHRIPIGKNKDNLNYQTKKELVNYTKEAYKFANKIIQNSDILLTHSFFAVPCGVLSLKFKRKYNIPYIVSLRGADVPGYSDRFTNVYRFFTWLIHKVWQNAEFVVTNSKGLTELASKSLNSQKFECIVNGIDTNYYTPGVRDKNDRKEEFRILCASRLSHRKGFIYAIDAMPEIIERYPNVKMIIAGGDGGVMNQLKGHAQALGVKKYIDFIGHYTKTEAPNIYRDSDIFLMPSLNEGMSNNLLEALASGLPVLMTRTGGAEELIKDGINGFLLNMKDYKDIRDKLLKFLDNPGLCDDMGKESRKIAMSMTWSNVANEYLKLYRKIRDEK